MATLSKELVHHYQDKIKRRNPEVEAAKKAVLSRKAREGRPTKDRAAIEARKKPMLKRYDPAGEGK